MRHDLLLSTAAAALLLTGTAVAAGTTPAIGPQANSMADATLQGDVVVTANRSEQPADRVGESVTVITAKQIEAEQTAVVADLLARTPGVTVSRNGGVGGTTSLRIRGAEADQTVVVIDGVKLNDPSGPGGGYNFGNLLIGDIARIEVRLCPGRSSGLLPGERHARSLRPDRKSRRRGL